MTNPETAALARIRQMVDHWEQQLPDVIRTPAVVSALRAALESAAPTASPAVVEPPATPSADGIRDQLIHAIDHAYTTGVLGYGTPEELLAAYDTSRTPQAADRAALRKVIAHAIHRYDNRHALSGNDIPSKHHYGEADAVLAVLPEPADRAAVLRWAAAAIEAHQAREEATAWAQSDEDEPDPEIEIEGAAVRAAAGLLRRMADETATTKTPDTLPAWLHWRFGPHGQPWADVPAEDKTLWEHQARAVRRAVARGGFKQPAAGARQDGATP